jgi:hypothetical protein
MAWYSQTNQLIGVYHSPVGYQNNYIGTLDPVTGTISLNKVII